MTKPAHLTPPDALAIFAVSVMLLIFGAPPLFQRAGLAGMGVAQVVFLAAPVIALAAQRAGSLPTTLSMLGVRRPAALACVGAVLVGISFWYVNLIVVAPIAERIPGGAEAAKEIQQKIIGDEIPLWLTYVVVAVFPAMCEELLLRGAVARSLRATIGFTGAIAVSALLFGLLHMNPAQALPATVFGLALGYATLRADSVVPSMIMHLVSNATVIVVASRTLPGLTELTRSHHAPCLLVATAISVAGFVLLHRASPRNPGSAVRS